MQSESVNKKQIQEVKIKKYVVLNKFKKFLPDTQDFVIAEEAVSVLKENEFIIKAQYISVDAYMRVFAESQEPPYDQFGFQLSKVVESRNPEFPVDALVVAHAGWRDAAVLDGSGDDIFYMKPYIPRLGTLSPTLAIGALGMPGMTAYLGFLEICKPKEKEVVCVSSAAGTVGSIVGQIARIKGCTVVGICGTDEKVKVVKDTFRFHHGINYKKEKRLVDKLKSIAPQGIDCYFDNVGGEVSRGVLQCMRAQGRVARCGALSACGAGALSEQDSLGSLRRVTVSGAVTVEAFSFSLFDLDKQRSAAAQLAQWLAAGDIRVKENIIVGFDKLPQTLINLLHGEYIGKALVKV